MINRFSLQHRIVEKMLALITSYFNSKNYGFTYKFIYTPEKIKNEKSELSWKEKYLNTKEGKKEWEERERKFRKKVGIK